MCINVDTNELEALAAALAGRELSIRPHLPLCERLWSNPRHRCWLIAALLAKLAVVNEEPDEPAGEFLAQKLCAALGPTSGRALPTTEAVAEVLPAIVVELPDSVWREPKQLWPALLSAVREAFDLPPSDKTGSSETPDQTAVDLAGFWSRALLGEWGAELEAEVADWENKPGYAWLAGLRKAMAFEESLAAVHDAREAPQTLSAARLCDLLAEMSPFERARFLLIQDVTNGEQYPATPEIDPSTPEAEWRFRLLVSDTARFEIHLEGLPIGDLSVKRGPPEEVTVDDAAGLLNGLTSQGPVQLRLRRAAAVADWHQLAPWVWGSICATPEGVELRVKWREQPPSV